MESASLLDAKKHTRKQLILKKNQKWNEAENHLRILTATAPYTIIALIVNIRREMAKTTHAFSVRDGENNKSLKHTVIY